jgi:hypothetical protein
MPQAVHSRSSGAETDTRLAAARLLTFLSPLLLLGACGSGGNETRTPPYVVQDGCEFTLEVGDGNSTSTTIEKGNTIVTFTLSMGGHSVDISDCRVVDNPQGLPVYVD